jgi:hypothetical protein
MDDADDAIARAMAGQRQLAARSVVRRDELQPQLEKARAQRAEIEPLLASDADAASLAKELDERIDALEGELALVEGHLSGAQKEMAALKGLKGDAAVQRARAIAASVLDKDPFMRSTEDVALTNVRQHIGDRAREADLNDELSGRTKAFPQTPEDKEAEARRMYEELKAKRKNAPAPDEGEPPPSRPKRTL